MTTAGRFGFTVTGFTGTCTAPGAVASFTGYVVDAGWASTGRRV